MKKRDRYLKKIPKALTYDPGKIDDLFDKMASKWAMRAERRMKPYYRHSSKFTAATTH
ncbi:hypothetical protein HYX70_04260 [Candidatus Saccharibacteria bacterium]|nr:hypothetical protein [Candidatus Saccharibacteria bacterium]